jgi:hypothetical protein
VSATQLHRAVRSVILAHTHASGARRIGLLSSTHRRRGGRDGVGGGEGARSEPGRGGAGRRGDGEAGVERGCGGGGERDGTNRSGGGHRVRVARVVGVRGHLVLPRALRRDHVRAHPRPHVTRPRRAGDPPAQRHGRREGAGWSDPKPCLFTLLSPSRCSIWLLFSEWPR